MKKAKGEIVMIDGEQLRHDRLAAGFFIYQLAAKARIQPSTISNIENGRMIPRVDEIRRIRRVLDNAKK